jgi:LmbE family N-acetylglucosaminyl deacetylase
MRLVLVALLFLSASLPLAARTRAVRHPAGIAAPKSVMWIAAHPDDEVVAAPLLAKWCNDAGARCAFLVLTRGEAGPCLLKNGCSPDVRTVRSSEAAAAAELFRADSILLRLPDGGGIAAPQWHAAGDGPDVVTTIAAYIEAFRPELVLTFDPRHGTTCHPDHRETGRIVLEAAKRISTPINLYFLETRVEFSNDPLRVSFVPAAPSAERFDAREVLASTGKPAWSAVVADMERHPSQFDEHWIAAIAEMPAEQWAVYIAAADDILRQYVAPCE